MYTCDIRSVVGVYTPVGVVTEWLWSVLSKLECTLRQGKGMFMICKTHYVTYPELHISLSFWCHLWLESFLFSSARLSEGRRIKSRPIVEKHLPHDAVSQKVSETMRLNLSMWLNSAFPLFPNAAVGNDFDVIISAMTSQFTSVSIVYPTVCSCADQRKHLSSVSLTFVWWFHRWPLNFPHKGPVMRIFFPFDDVIITWNNLNSRSSACMDSCGDIR